jgi:RES domain-containing protein
VLKIWRLEKERYVGEAFRGKGSLKTSGRWHHKGTQVAYASEHPGVAVLEKLAWLGSYEVARDSSYLLVPLEIDPDEHLERIEEPELPQGWDAFPHRDETRDIGTGWFDEERSPVLGVPSAVLSIAENYLINPFHPQFHKLDRGEPKPFSWNRRLFQRGRQEANGE